MTDQTHTRTVDFELRDNSDGLTLAGYAAVFDAPAQISDWKGTYTETIARGAFTRAIRANPRPVVQFDHGQHPLLGSIPIAALQSLREDQRGLFMEATLHDNWLTEPVRDAITSGAITGMSFRFSVPDGGEDFDTATNTRTVNDVNLYELGPVVFPAYDGTTVGVRAQELAVALEDPTARHDLAIALLLTGTEERTDDPTEDVASEDVAEPVTEEPTNTADPEEEVSAPNTAARYATLYAVRTEQTLRRST